MTKRIVLCADDYGQAEAVSRGILELMDVGRLTAVSCLVNMPGWKEQAQFLHPFKGKIDLGLHLNLTDGMPLSAQYQREIGAKLMPLPYLITHTMLGSKKLKPTALMAEIEAQLDAFCEAVGCLPDFVDGHQHVHH